MISCVAYSPTLKMDATCFYETSAEFKRITRRYMPGTSNPAWLMIYLLYKMDGAVYCLHVVCVCVCVCVCGGGGGLLKEPNVLNMASKLSPAVNWFRRFDAGIALIIGSVLRPLSLVVLMAATYFMER
jgi:hypothetical protein